MSPFLSWSEAFEAGPERCGGKGYNLARLARFGFRVPRGGVLPVSAPLSEIKAGLERAGLANARLAVRSSATAEDSARASSAGIHRSFLNIGGAAAAAEAAQGCIDSLQTPVAAAYRARMGFSDDEARCAVVICEMVEARCAGVRELAEFRGERRERWLAETAPDLIVEQGEMLTAATTAVAAESGLYTGIAVSPGVATGTARVVHSPHDAAHLRQGDVLIAPSTDPGWTPLFLRAAGIVMETGGFLSHGAIVAREYGIPAVANVPGILAAVEDGAEIAVDGSGGRVIL